MSLGKDKKKRRRRDLYRTFSQLQGHGGVEDKVEDKVQAYLDSRATLFKRRQLMWKDLCSETAIEWLNGKFTQW